LGYSLNLVGGLSSLASHFKEKKRMAIDDGSISKRPIADLERSKFYDDGSISFIRALIGEVVDDGSISGRPIPDLIRNSFYDYNGNSFLRIVLANGITSTGLIPKQLDYNLTIPDKRQLIVANSFEIEASNSLEIEGNGELHLIL
jgi:hypothetical protein